MTVPSAPAVEAARGTVVAAIDAVVDDLVALSRLVHGHPEVALEERLAGAAAADVLAARVFAVERGVAGMPTAFRATTGAGSPRVADLAE